MNLSFGTKLQQLRKAANLNQTEMVAKISIERSYLSKLENDKSIPSKEMLERIADFFHLTVVKFMENVDPQIIADNFQHIPELSSAIFKFKKQQRQKNIFKHSLFALSLLIGLILLFLAKSEWFYHNSAIIYQHKAIEVIDSHNFRRVNKLVYSFDYLGSGFAIEEKNDELSQYFFSMQANITHKVNRWFTAIGVWLLVIGLVYFNIRIWSFKAIT